MSIWENFLHSICLKKETRIEAPRAEIQLEAANLFKIRVIIIESRVCNKEEQG